MNHWDTNSPRPSVHSEIRNRTQKSSSCGVSHGVIWGAAVCILGVILLLDHLGYVSASHLWRFWPMLIVVGGVASFSQPGRRAWGAFLIAVGALFQLDSLGLIRFRWFDLWPLIIIAAGLMMIWGSIEARRIRVSSAGDTPEGDTGNTMNVAAIFGGIERKIVAPDFRGGTVSAVFGGAELDFRGADMEADETVLEVNAVFGGAEIRVPETWRVEVRGQTIFGGYSDSTRTPAVQDANAPKRKTLILTGTTLFGGVEVKN